ncbi:MAG: hypothetical protein A3F31_05440 [Candidatus Levybacteria bacterium RIFCSPHIGHO2_12_FULL_38_12]|nr:MAG: hypothetical protein A3F31_05440 [Candidatus Levybacteria bacterium RIFCSPHIGHO2_12_FULL_38_12]OGH44371.1 MAG: hypothetical protein A3J14_02205 [Candidatus Levybacteria bacterium RIFCSPLOWO2_02_FULL_37_18]
MQDKNSLIIGFLQRNLLVVFGTEINGVLTVDLKEDLVKDLEVIDKNKLENQIKVFAANFKLPPCNIILVLSEAVIFQKDIIGVNQNEIDSYIQDFLDNIPVETVSSKLFPIENGVKIIAVNRQLYEVIGKTFQSLGFSVLSIIPEILLDKKIVEEQTGIDTDTTSFLNNMDYIKSNTIWSQTIQLKSSLPALSVKKEKTSEHTGKRMYVFLATFVFLLFSLIVMLLIKL